ncbi:protoglobin domain-containing protein [Paenibacillus provencensis]|uniref:Protoglobin domain-containing protein n=1 Tax=Paenibacillus provencensis TaxID=441151 RepID=A0ABW3Q759_9BACL|nr:globin-coupled sensor protein [Paenibacillus sp. MER 78]MCM3127354.1 globin-coupled sensor protein [Paenibacillus sp. MER 78]
MIEVSEDRERQLAYIGITNLELELLQNHRPIFEKIVEEVVDRLYDRIEQVEELRGIITKYSTIERLKQTQRWYFMSLTDGRINEDFIEKRIQIGLIHSKIGLKSDFYLGSYMVYLDVATSIVQQIMPNGWYPVIHALSKMFNFDSQLVLEAYEGKEKQKITDIADEQERLLQAITEVSQRLTGMIDELHNNTELIAETARQTAASQESAHKLIDDLNQEVKEIQKMGSLIREISDQSHLLGLNAAIEAAHAGDSGRGFEIVAGEIRKLATGSKKAMEQIQSVLNSIRTKLDQVQSESDNTKDNASKQVFSSSELMAFVQIMESVSGDLKELQASHS